MEASQIALDILLKYKPTEYTIIRKQYFLVSNMLKTGRA